MQLFQARSLIETLPNDDLAYRDVVVNWFYVGIRQPPRPYDELIAGYGELDELQRIYACRCVDELFTASEIEQLRRHLERLDGQTLHFGDFQDRPLRVEEMLLPVPGTLIGYSDQPAGGTAAVYRLAEQDGYDLPFAVHGYFDLSMPWLGEKIEQSVGYLRRALQSLGVDAGIKQEDVRAVAEKLYRRSRLYVAQEMTHQNWLEKVDFDPEETPS